MNSSPPSRATVSLLQGLHQPVGDALDDLVAGAEAERIVDQLEPVEVDQHHRERLPRAARALDRLGQPVVEQEAVGQPGQGIVVGEAAQGLLGLPPPRDVAHDQDDHPPPVALQVAALHLHRHELAGAPAHDGLERRTPSRRWRGPQMLHKGPAGIQAGG
jgi:hypothetical protein